MIQLVFAHNGYEFGAENGMPWQHISDDFKNFKKRTENTILVMGAKTFASLPCVLKNRTHLVVVDQNRLYPIAKNGDVAHFYISEKDFEQILQTHQTQPTIYSVIGGKNILEKALPYASKIVKTEIQLGFVPPEKRIKCTQWLDYKFLNEIENMDCEENNVFAMFTEKVFLNPNALKTN